MIGFDGDWNYKLVNDLIKGKYDNGMNTNIS